MEGNARNQPSTCVNELENFLLQHFIVEEKMFRLDCVQVFIALGVSFFSTNVFVSGSGKKSDNLYIISCTFAYMYLEELILVVPA